MSGASDGSQPEVSDRLEILSQLSAAHPGSNLRFARIEILPAGQVVDDTAGSTLSRLRADGEYSNAARQAAKGAVLHQSLL